MLVQDVMQTKLFTVTPETTLPEALYLTGQRGVRHLPVVGPDDQPNSGRLGARGSGIHRPAGLEKLMARRGVAGIVVVWLLASGLGLACGRLNTQERAALVAQGQRLFTDKGCYGCHTIGTTGTPIAPDLRAAAVRYPEANLARCYAIGPPRSRPVTCRT